MDNSFIILDTKRLERANEAGKWLGRITMDYTAPGHYFTPNNPLPTTKGRIKCSFITNIEQKVNASQNKGLGATLSKIASLSLQSDRQATLDFSTSCLMSVRLENYPIVFRELLKDEVRATLTDMFQLSGSTLYMIVGLLIWTDARFVESIDVAKKKQLRGQISVGSIIESAASHGALATGVGNVDVDLSTGGELHVLGQGVSPESHIFAFEYKTVGRKFVPSLVGSFQPKLTTRGPRVKGDKVFAGSTTAEGQGEKESSSMEVKHATFFVAEENEVWTESELISNKLSEAPFGDIVFAQTQGQGALGSRGGIPGSRPGPGVPGKAAAVRPHQQQQPRPGPKDDEHPIQHPPKQAPQPPHQTRVGNGGGGGAAAATITKKESSAPGRGAVGVQTVAGIATGVAGRGGGREPLGRGTSGGANEAGNPAGSLSGQRPRDPPAVQGAGPGAPPQREGPDQGHSQISAGSLNTRCTGVGQGHIPPGGQQSGRGGREQTVSTLKGGQKEVLLAPSSVQHETVKDLGKAFVRGGSQQVKTHGLEREAAADSVKVIGPQLAPILLPNPSVAKSRVSSLPERIRSHIFSTLRPAVQDLLNGKEGALLRWSALVAASGLRADEIVDVFVYLQAEYEHQRSGTGAGKSLVR